MNEYTIYCNPIQTRKALELGAPIHYVIGGSIWKDRKKYLEPTTEELMGWLREEKNIFFAIKKVGECNYVTIGDLKLRKSYDTYKEAILAAIDAALEYLINNKK